MQIYLDFQLITDIKPYRDIIMELTQIFCKFDYLYLFTFNVPHHFSTLHDHNGIISYRHYLPRLNCYFDRSTDSLFSNIREELGYSTIISMQPLILMTGSFETIVRLYDNVMKDGFDNIGLYQTIVYCGTLVKFSSGTEVNAKYIKRWRICMDLEK